MVGVLGVVGDKDSKGLVTRDTSVVGAFGSLNVVGRLVGRAEVDAGLLALGVAGARVESGRGEAGEGEGGEDLERDHFDRLIGYQEGAVVSIDLRKGL